MRAISAGASPPTIISPMARSVKQDSTHAGLAKWLDELRGEQDLADAEERAGGVPSIRLQRREILLLPMAMWAALEARQEEASRQYTGLLFAQAADSVGSASSAWR